MYEPSRVLSSFHIAGFQYGDGAMVLSELTPGELLSMCPEPDNPHDPEAVAIYRGDIRLGYVPAGEIPVLPTMLHYGHGDAFELRVQQVAAERSPWHQVRVGLFVIDAR